MVDIFTMDPNHNLSLNFSSSPLDTMVHHCGNLSTYASRLIPLIRVMTNKFQMDGMDVLLRVPAWHKQQCLPNILSILIDPLVRLLLWEKLLKQPHRELFHSQHRTLNLHTWGLSPHISKRREASKVVSADHRMSTTIFYQSSGSTFLIFSIAETDLLKTTVSEVAYSCFPLV